MASPAPSHADTYTPSSSGQVAASESSSAMKLTGGHSCVLCQQRMVHCDQKKLCASRVKAGVECKVDPPQPPRRRKKRWQERDLLDRLRKYEALLSQHNVQSEPVGQTPKAAVPGGDEVEEIEHGIEGLKTSSSPTGPTGPTGKDDGHGDKHPFRCFLNHREMHPQDAQSRDSLNFRDSSDDSLDGHMIHHAFDEMFDGQHGFPFVIGGSAASVSDLQPPGVQIFQLWQIYLENVHPLLKMTHTPTVQASLIEAAANPSRIAKPLDA